MESNLNKISVDIPNYSGPLEVLLDLAKSQKVDLAEISITKLADQFLQFIKNSKNLKGKVKNVKILKSNHNTLFGEIAENFNQTNYAA